MEMECTRWEIENFYTTTFLFSLPMIYQVWLSSWRHFIIIYALQNTSKRFKAGSKKYGVERMEAELPPHVDRGWERDYRVLVGRHDSLEPG